MFVWGIFMSHEDRDETIHDDKFHYDLFATEERALEYLKEQEKWWHNIYNDPCITDAAKKEIFGGKSQTNPFTYSKSLPKSAAKKMYGFLLAITFPQLEPKCAKESWQKNYQ